MSGGMPTVRKALPGFLAVAAFAFTGPTISCAQEVPSAQTEAATDWILANSEAEDMVMIPMRDGVRLYNLILFPKGRPRQNLPTVLVRSPYPIDPRKPNFPRQVRSFLEHGYAVVYENARGRYFSQGTYTYLVRSGDDGFDTVDWITRQPWSNGKLGTFGCSGSAEEQHKLNASHPAGLAATVPMSSGAGIGRVGPYNEHGNFYRGGAIQMGWFNWYYGYGYTDRPQFPSDTSREKLIQLHRYWSLEPQNIPPSDIETRIWTLPINSIMNRMRAAPSDMDRFVTRAPNDPAWEELDAGGEGDTYSAPMLMINAWYDISLGPNTAMFEYQAAHGANATARENLFMVIAPTTHCTQGSVESEHTIVGERDMGDARFDYIGLIQRWFDHWVKGVDNGVIHEPKVRAYMMGSNRWQTYGEWPPREVAYKAFYLGSGGHANTAAGDGRLSKLRPGSGGSDTFLYDPLNPVPSHGGGQQGWGINSTVFKAGADDQRLLETRRDVLVYTTPPLRKPLAVMGPVSVSLYLSSDRKDTDLTVKLLDVYPDGRAYNLDESIQRVRWREGWDHPVFMEPGHVYKVNVGPLQTGNTFLPGHRVRIEVSSSNFPFFERNLNTGGHNYDESVPLVARNAIHHGGHYPSTIVLPVLPDEVTSAPPR